MPEEDMGLGLAERLQTLVSRKFQQAYHNKALLFSDTALHVLRINQGPSVSRNIRLRTLMACSQALVPATILPGIGQQAQR